MKRYTTDITNSLAAIHRQIMAGVFVLALVSVQIGLASCSLDRAVEKIQIPVPVPACDCRCLVETQDLPLQERPGGEL
jgi:hypothetical protein